MSRSKVDRNLARLSLVAGALVLVVSCGPGDTPSEPQDPTISFSLNPTSATVAQGGTVAVEGTATVGGSFTGSVAVTAEGVPGGITAAVSNLQSDETTTTVTVTLSVATTVAAGTYPITLRAAGSGISVDATFTLTVNVTAPTGTQVSMDFSACASNDQPLWLAYQDGAGPWTQVVGVSDVYGFTVSAASAGVAYVSGFSTEEVVYVQYLTEAEWGAGELVQFCNTPGVKTINATVANSAVGTRVSIGSVNLTLNANTSFQFFGVGPGALDLVGYSPLMPARMLFLRDQDVPHLGDIGTIDFAGSDAFDAISASITIAGPNSGGALIGGTEYNTVSQGGAVCSVAQLSFGGLTNPYTAVGPPIANQNADDFHVVAVTASTGGGGIQSVREAFHALADRTVTLGPEMPAITPTDVTGGGNYLRLQADFALPTEYDGFSWFTYFQAGQNIVSIFASNGVHAGNVSLSLPDFSAVTGWTDNWAPASAATGVQWVITGSAQASALPLCTEGGRSISASQVGQHN